MARGSKGQDPWVKNLSPAVIPSLPQRLHDAAAAFYCAGILTSAPFDLESINKYHGRSDTDLTIPIIAAEEALAGPNRVNHIHIPPVVNFAFSIEPYIKLLIFLANRKLLKGATCTIPLLCWSKWPLTLAA